MNSHSLVRAGTISRLRKVLLVALLPIPLAGHALDVEVSGQVNRALMQGDNGADSETLHVDNDISGTRFRLGAAQDIDSGLRAGAVFEAEFQSNPSNSVSLTDRSDDPELDERHFYVYFEGGFGFVSLGQGSGAADGGTEVDLSGTAVAQNSLGVSAIGGGIEFASGDVVTGPELGDVMSNQDFESRYDRLLYQTPALGPVKIALSTGVKDSADVTEAALKFGGALAGGKVAAVLGFSSQERDGAGEVDDDTVGGSVSWLAPSGISVTLAHSRRDVAAGREGKFNYAKLGYRTGKHAVSADFGTAEDLAQTGDEAEMIGVAYVYQAAKWAELYAAAKETSLDRPGTAFDDIRVLMVGSRLKF